MTAAPAPYARVRVGVQLALRALRLARHVALAWFTGGDGRWWLAKLLSVAARGGRGPGRALATLLFLLPMVFLQSQLMHPCPVALHWPAMPLAVVAVWCYTWQPLVAVALRADSLAAAVAALCSRLRVGLALVDAGTIAAFG
jgi:hypothetical protein